VRKLLPPQPLPLGIRRMHEADLPAVLELQARCFAHPWSADLVKRELTHEWSTVLVAEDGGTSLVGFLIFWLVHDEVHILNVGTDPTHRRRGVARALLSETILRGRARGCSVATLEVRRSNTPAINLYKAFGFRPVGVRPNYYAEEKEDAIVMVADL
jgi:[ribosomal protein S18]-alanine N-acetyltransferase